MERIEEIKQYVETMRALHSNHGAVDKLEYLLAVIEERDKRIELMTLTETEREHLLRQLKYNQSKAKQANKELSAATKLVESLEKQIMTLAKEKEQAEADDKMHQEVLSEKINDYIDHIKLLKQQLEQAVARVRELESLVAGNLKQIGEVKHFNNNLNRQLTTAREGLLDIQRALGNKGRPHPGYPTPIKDIISIAERTLKEMGDVKPPDHLQEVKKLRDALGDVIALADREHHKKYKEEVDVEALLPDILIIAKEALEG